MGGLGDVYTIYMYLCHFPMVAPICSSVQLPFIYLNLSTVLVPVADLAVDTRYHIISSFITSLLEQGPQGWPNVSYLRVLDKS